MSFVLLLFKSAGDDETPRASLALLWAWFAAAFYSQFFGPTGLVNAGGLAAQTLLAVVLLAWWKLQG